MKLKTHLPHARDYITSLASAGRYHFTSSDARDMLGVSPDAAKLALYRLSRQNLIAQPARGFYVIIPPEYRSLGCLPADQFIPAMMEWLNLSYYTGLLSAAQYHGAAHHRPQEFQVMLVKSRRPIRCGQVRVAFIIRKRLADVPTQTFNTPRGTLQVSTPEATAVDLVGYPHHTGGLDQVATILSELAERVDPRKLVETARTAPVSWTQRLGFLLEQVGAAETAANLKGYVVSSANQTVLLQPGAPHRGRHLDPDWKVIVNADVEPEL